MKRKVITIRIGESPLKFMFGTKEFHSHMTKQLDLQGVNPDDATVGQMMTFYAGCLYSGHLTYCDSFSFPEVMSKEQILNALYSMRFMDVLAINDFTLTLIENKQPNYN